VRPYAWEWDAEALVLVPALFLGYLLALRRFPASRGRIAAFVAGLLLTLAVFATPVQSLALRYLLTMHLLQNVVLAEWAPALLVAGLSPALAARLTRPAALRALTSPFVALPIWLAVYFAWHLPWPYDTALRHPGSLLHVEHVSYLLAGSRTCRAC
jgi:putative membrane protein